MTNKKKVPAVRVTKPEIVKEKNTPFRTNDAGCAAALMCIGFELVLTQDNDCEAHPGDMFYFHFSSDLAEAVRDYEKDDLFVPARSYFDTIEMLTRKVYTGFTFD